MHALKRNLVALAMTAAFASPAVFAQATSVTGAAHATVPSTPAVPAAPTLPTQASSRATDAVSAKTTAKETKPATAKAGEKSKVAVADKAKASQNMSAEATTSPPGKGGDWWKAADADGDGKISTVESTANAGLSSRFSTIDANKDGFVTSEEYRSFFTSEASKGETHAAANSAVVTRDLWVKLDANADSKISLTEAKANADLTGSFTDMDINADGFITQDEYRAFAQMKK
jgi:hypothetical protein